MISRIRDRSGKQIPFHRCDLIYRALIAQSSKIAAKTLKFMQIPTKHQIKLICRAYSLLIAAGYQVNFAHSVLQGGFQPYRTEIFDLFLLKLEFLLNLEILKSRLSDIFPFSRGQLQTEVLVLFAHPTDQSQVHHHRVIYSLTLPRCEISKPYSVLSFYFGIRLLTLLHS